MSITFPIQYIFLRAFLCQIFPTLNSLKVCISTHSQCADGFHLNTITQNLTKNSTGTLTSQQERPPIPKPRRSPPHQRGIPNSYYVFDSSFQLYVATLPSPIVYQVASQYPPNTCEYLQPLIIKRANMFLQYPL